MSHLRGGAVGVPDAGVPRGASRRRGMALTALVAAISVGAVGALPGVAGADAVAAKREEARRLEATIEAQGERLSIVVERYNRARLDVDQVTVAVLAARAHLAAAERTTLDMQARARSRAVALYEAAGTPAPFALFAARDAQDLGVRAKYAAATAAHVSAVLEDLRRSREDLTRERSLLEADMASARAVQHRLDGERADVAAAMTTQKVTLARVQGELAALVAEEQARRRAEAARRAREALSRRFGRSSRGNLDLANVPAPNARAGTAVDVARSELGKPYQWGAAGPDSFDCSGLTMYSWDRAGVPLPHSAAAQYDALPHVPVESLAPGDLVFFGNPIHHVGIYIGNGEMINAPQTGEDVRVDSIYRSGFAGAARPG